MHQHPRRSPVTSLPARSPRTNPERTNNQREEEDRNDAEDSEGAMPSEQGFRLGEGAEAMLRIQEASTQGKESVAKLSQIVQVRNLMHPYRRSIQLTFLTELLHQGCFDYHQLESLFTTCIHKGLENQKNKQVGKHEHIHSCDCVLGHNKADVW